MHAPANLAASAAGSDRQRRVIVGQRERIDVNAVAFEAIERALRRRRGGDARDDAEARAGEIRHAGGAVVDDGQPAARKSKIAQGRQTRMGRGEHVDLRRARGPRRARRAARGSSSASCAKRQPASEPASPCTMPMRKRADLRDEMHRQARRAASRAVSRRRGAQQRQDLVGARDHGRGHALRIGAAAAGADIVGARDFGLDIAAQRPMRRDAALRCRRTSRARHRTSGNRR